MAATGHDNERLVADWLAQALRRGQPGDRLPTVRDLMRRFGTAQRVVERALHAEVAAGRLIMRRGAGIIIAEPVVTQVAWEADLLVLYRLSDSRLARNLLQAREQRLKARGVSMLQIGYTSEAQARSVLVRLGRFRTCLVQLHFEMLPIPFLAALADHAAAVVVDGVSATGIEVDAIGTNWREALMAAFHHLRRAGHRRIAYFTSAHPARQIAMARREYRQLCAGEGLPDWLLETPELPGSYRSEDIRDAIARHLDARGRPAFSALIVWGLVEGYLLDRALYDLGLTPGRDLSVIVLGSVDFPSEHLRRFDVVGNSNDEKLDLFERVLAARIAMSPAPPEVHYLPIRHAVHGSVAEIEN